MVPADDLRKMVADCMHSVNERWQRVPETVETEGAASDCYQTAWLIGKDAAQLVGCLNVHLQGTKASGAIAALRRVIGRVPRTLPAVLQKDPDPAAVHQRVREQVFVWVEDVRRLLQTFLVVLPPPASPDPS